MIVRDEETAALVLDGSRRRVFQRVRAVVGPEICPAVSAAQMALIQSGADEVALELGSAAATTHHLRHALVAALMRLRDPSGPCPNCGDVMLPHRACPACGYYKGRQVTKGNAEELE